MLNCSATIKTNNMFFKYCIFLSHIALSSSSFLSQHNTNYYHLPRPKFIPSIPQLLHGVTLNCDVRILWDGLQEFDFDSFYQWPTTSIFVPDYFTKYQVFLYGYLIDKKDAVFALNTLQTKIPRCVINLLFIGNQNTLHISTHSGNYQYFNYYRQVTMSLYLTIGYNHYLGWNNEWILTEPTTIYTILVTEFIDIEMARFKLIGHNYNYVENFAIIFPSNSETLSMSICVAVRTEAADLSKIKCQNLDKRISLTNIITKNWSPAPYWRYGRDKHNEEIAESNPFDGFSNKSIELYLFKQILAKENENITIYFTSTCIWNSRHCQISPIIAEYESFFLHTEPPTVASKWKGLQWLTCYTKQYLGFEFYLKPFQPNLWIGYAVTMSTVVGVSWIYVRYYFDGSFSPWLFVLGTMFEETSSVPLKLEQKTFYRLSIGIWCLMVAILTNCYNGLMITDLNSPLPGSKIESFRDLLCDRSLFENNKDFNISQWIQTSNIASYWGKFSSTSKSNPYGSSNCFNIWSPEFTSRNLPKRNALIWEFFKVYFFHGPSMILSLSENGTQPGLLSYSDKIFWSLLHPGHPRREPRKITKIRIEEERIPSMDEMNVENQHEITNCEQKSAYIANSEVISLELDFLTINYFDKEFYTGQDMIRVEMDGWTFEDVGRSKIVNNYRWMIDSGIWDRLEVEKMARKRRLRKVVKMNDDKMKQFRPEGVSSLGGGLVTLFILCGVVISLALILFMVECRHLIWEFLVKSYLCLSRAIRNCCHKLCSKVRKRCRRRKIGLENNKVFLVRK